MVDDFMQIFKRPGLIKYGFSLIETMIALSILVMVITGPLTLASYSLKSASRAKDNFIAANLAQEGIELIRHYWTNNIIQCSVNCDTAWLDDLRSPGPAECQTGKGCYIDAKNINGDGTQFILNKCTGSSCPPLNIDTGGFYNYSAVTGTNKVSNFTRTIIITPITPDVSARVRVEITWKEHGGTQSLVVEEIIFNWLRNTP
jgi:prepilin-type N-terminal cleavage/methylation domain-containing protein